MAITNQFLIEIDTYDTVTSAVIVERYATGKGFITAKSETPSLAEYLPLIIDTGSVEQYLFGKSRTTGSTVSAAGKVVLNNASGRLNFLQDRGLDGRSITIRERTGDAYPANFPIRFCGVVDTISFSSRRVTIDIKSSLFNVKQEVYQPIKYAGTNNGASIYVEGTSDLEGVPKPKLLGNGSNGNMPAVLVDRVNEIYQLSSDPIDTLDTVYVGRSVITAATVHTTLAAFIADVTVTPPAAGTYDLYLGDYTKLEGDNERGAFISFGTTPNRRVTFDATEGWKNLALHSEDHTNAAWVATTTTVVANSVVAPDGNITAETLTATGANSTLLQTVTIASAQHVYSVWLQRKTGVGNVDITVNGGTTWETKILTTSMSRFEVSPVTAANPQFGVRIVTSGDEVYMWGSQLEEHPKAGPYIKTTTTATYNYTAAGNMWKVMDLRGFLLDADSIADTNNDNSSDTFHFQGTQETQIGNVLDFLTGSIKSYLFDTVAGKFITGVFKPPTLVENARTFNIKVLLGEPKVKKLRLQDSGRGIPIHKAVVQWGQNYVVMTESEVTGIAELTDMPFVSLQYRNVVSQTVATKTKHLNAQERLLATGLTTDTAAAARGVSELALYDQTRFIVEIRVPFKFGFDLERGDVVRIEDRIYRIIGKFLKFPTAGSGISTNLVILQAWGGVKV